MTTLNNTHEHWVPRQENNFVPKFPVKMGSLSLTIIITKLLWFVQGVAKDWYYDIQIGTSCSLSSVPNFPRFMLKEGYWLQAPSSNNIARTWRGNKNHIGTWSSHRNKNSTVAKSINFAVSCQVEELTCWRFHMGGWEFYTEASITTQVLRKTLFWRGRAC